MHKSTKMKCMYIACLCPTLVFTADTLWNYLFCILFKCKYPYSFFGVHQDLLSFYLVFFQTSLFRKGALYLIFFLYSFCCFFLRLFLIFPSPELFLPSLPVLFIVSKADLTSCLQKRHILLQQMCFFCVKGTGSEAIRSELMLKRDLLGLLYGSWIHYFLFMLNINDEDHSGLI